MFLRSSLGGVVKQILLSNVNRNDMALEEMNTQRSITLDSCESIVLLMQKQAELILLKSVNRACKIILTGLYSARNVYSEKKPSTSRASGMEGAAPFFVISNCCFLLFAFFPYHSPQDFDIRIFLCLPFLCHEQTAWYCLSNSSI